MTNILRAAVHLFRVNPSLFLKRIFFECKMRLCVFYKLPNPTVKALRGVRFPFYFTEASNRRRMYFGLYEMGVVNTMEKFLKKGDVFLDVGANIGYLSAVGAGLVGEKGEVHTFEPIPQYSRRIEEVAAANPQYQFVVNQAAIGERDGSVSMFVSGVSMGYSTAVPELLKENEIEATITVPLMRLDSYLKAKNITRVKLIKIDVEGFELPVLQGLREFLEIYQPLPLIICEIVPFSYSKLGYKLQDLFSYMERFSYTPYDIANPNRRLSQADIIGADTSANIMNVLFKPSSL